MGIATWHFDPRKHERMLLPMLEEIRSAEQMDDRALARLVRRYPKLGGGSYSKSEILRAYRFFAPQLGWEDDERFTDRVRMKPVRTQSGVAPVTVLTRPYPCPGRCIFCPNDVRMPKSYLSREPGAQRAAQHEFDPYGQALARLLAFYYTGHRVDKVELIILGGTWSFYPEPYQIWFTKRCFDAMNDFASYKNDVDLPEFPRGTLGFASLEEEVEGLTMERSYNQVVADFLKQRLDGELVDGEEVASWDELNASQLVNERAAARCVGLVVETRPDHLTREEVVRIRRLGATKVQIGIQSLDDRVLRLNKRGHDVAATRRALSLLRQAGFKLHAHWMPNLYGSSPAQDLVDFSRLFDDPTIRPDELKIYPCSLIESAELMQVYERGEWQPYSREELLEILETSMLQTPPYCRLTRVIRDIPGDDIVTGNKTTNFREVVEKSLASQGLKSRDIRAREVRGQQVSAEDLRLDRVEYETSIGREIFLQFVTEEDRLAGFLRLSLPAESVFLPEIQESAMIREVHVYGRVVGIGKQNVGRSQHLGLGRRLVEEAVRLAVESGYRDLAVISSVGTREYYRGLGFDDGELYQHRALMNS
jgi:elongator complex protein 3